MREINVENLPRACCSCSKKNHDSKLVVLTGGPGAGKTAILKLARQIFCQHVVPLPEAASIVFGGGFIRRDSIPARKASQRAIYHVQRQLEALILEEGTASVALCDRGTVDGLAYWPKDCGSLWEDVGASIVAELDRYSAVIHLRTPDLKMGYNHENPLRVETAKAAQEIDEKIMDAWASHPNRVVIDSSHSFMDKANEALSAIKENLDACCQDHDTDNYLTHKDKK